MVNDQLYSQVRTNSRVSSSTHDGERSILLSGKNKQQGSNFIHHGERSILLSGKNQQQGSNSTHHGEQSILLSSKNKQQDFQLYSQWLMINSALG
jgi:hypothetical protein